MATSTKSRFNPTAITGFSALLMTTFLVGCSEPPKLETVEGYAQGTTYQISFWSEDAVPVTEVQAAFNDTLAQIDKELSTYRPDSFISEFNRSPSVAWQPVSQDFVELVQIAQDIHTKSEGCYDPTIGPLFDLWGFKTDKLHVPTPEELVALTSELGIDKIEVDEENLRVRKTRPFLQLDFSSMGEGYTIGKLSHVLESKGYQNYMVQFGGDMKIKGHKPNGDKWRVAIQSPIPSAEGGPKVYQVITVKNEDGVTLDTSGTYNRHFDDNGVEYSHIINPSTGKPITHNLISASVFGTDPRVSDAWATTMLCLGPVEGAKIAKNENLEVFFIERKNDKLVNSSSAALLKTDRVKFD
ncbi:MAG: FAD:protein FMN transferase [Gammaproteobacteria bacterium]|jgi:thiamine biosynthesis lipoprotein|uniref:FAD:protein FMN transferase n=1 Tax=Marinomonas sp. BSi20584 TaxID=1594462 RepID=UPI000C1E03DB|nr:FAD:protein FMN transferase [Marinomonas sp. BSi20584]MBU2023821.1 FAD:protein FMN transferase [Gammaproteobacteria bacterium]MBU2238264.1 FAD:protein FMN transferase [Gammaproteobacteria bacterium]MBU2318257.1 FAD:protein FMN transferase [Gammaproteobacteria bacterium]MBU2412709.1 FAD:protein FMN transferase [Gammaproteobacteria bacterium]PJE57269.1 thiamine biosynthesis protein ApbE [Marinomonas sp. BSi20584]